MSTENADSIEEPGCDTTRESKYVFRHEVANTIQVLGGLVLMAKMGQVNLEQIIDYIDEEANRLKKALYNEVSVDP